MRTPCRARITMIAVDERMHVVAGRGADIGERRKIGRRDTGEILFRSELHVAGFALENGDRHAVAHSASAASSVKSSRPATKAPPVSRQEPIIEKRLRGLHRAQPAAVDGIDDAAVRVHRLDGVGQRQSRNRAAAGARRDSARDQGRRGERAGGIVHQHDPGLFPFERFQPAAHRNLACRAAMGGGAQLQPGGRLRKGCSVTRVDHRLHHVDLGVVKEEAERVTDHGRAPNLAVLLGRAAAGPDAPAGRHHHHRYPTRHRPGLLQIASGRVRRVTRCLA